MTSYQTFAPVYFRPKYICITFSAKILLLNNINLQKTLTNVCELNVYLYVGILGVLGQFWDTHIDWKVAGFCMLLRPPCKD